MLETLREYWRWMRPKTWLFPGTLHNWRADKPITPKVVWEACQCAAQRAGIKSTFTLIYCDIPTPLIWRKQESTCAPFNSCWATSNWNIR